MKENLLKLVDLQNIDTKIFKINKSLEALPKDLAKQLEEFNPRLEKHQNNQQLAKEKEAENLKFKMELEEKATQLKTLQDRLSKVQNARELSAVDKEINAIKKEIGEIEETNIKLLDEIESLNKEISDEEQIIGEQQKQVDELKASIAEKEKETSGELSTLQKERNKIANTLPDDLTEKYMFIFEKRENKAIVAIRDGVCSGCFMSIPPQTVVDVKKGFELFTCQYCSRLLYYPEWE